MIQKDSGQILMTKFFTTNNCNQHNEDNTDIIFTQSKTQNNNLHNDVINPNDVKLLSDDNAGIDFLTLCTMKKSEEEMSSHTAYQMNTTYIPAFKPVKDLFNFIVPDIKIIDSFLMRLRDCDSSLTQHKNCENNLSCTNTNNDTKTNNDCINVDNDDDDNFWYSIRNEEHIDKNEIKFEDILDESSDSNEIPISHLSQRITNIEINTINKVSTANVESDNKTNDITSDITNVETKISIDMLDNTGPSMFENILNESFTSSEDDLKSEETAQSDTVFANSSNTFAIDVEKVTENTRKNINVFRDENNINRSNQHLSVSDKFTGSDHANKSAKNLMDDMQDFDFDSDDNINGFIKSEFEKNKSEIDHMYNSKAQESLLSITQAIDEIAQMKKDPKRSLESSKEELIDSTGWISVNNKREIKTGNIKSGIRLSNINRNFITRSRPIKQKFNFLNDSDEDFMVTEDNMRKFDELESSYFRDTKNSANDNSLPSTSRNAEIKHSISKNSKAENSYINNISRNLKLCDTSMPISHSRRPGLSLNRNKEQYSNVIDLIASHRCNTKDKNISECNADAPEETSVLVKNIKQKIKHKRKSKDIVKNEFIDDEAEVDADISSDESIIVTDEEDNNFVSYTQNPQDQIDMHAHYLQTIKSPIKRPGDFHFRRPRSPDSDEIYSQSLSQAQDTYLYVCKISNALETSFFSSYQFDISIYIFIMMIKTSFYFRILFASQKMLSQAHACMIRYWKELKKN